MTPCTEPGCDGRIREDGYCGECGAAPPAGSGVPTTTTGTRRIVVERLIERPTTRPVAATRSHIGAGVVHVEPAVGPDPSEVVLADPHMPESHRFCQSSMCDNEVGRSKVGKPGLVKGFCSDCGTPFDFEPLLKPNDLVAGQYRVEGAIAHGAMGWIYLAYDQNVSGRPCVLKGVIALEDEAAREAAEAERRELAQLSHHQNIVSVHNYVNVKPERTDGPSGAPAVRRRRRGPAPDPGYIVMEFLMGQNLKQIREVNRGPLPATQAISYMLAVLPAFGDMHRQGRVFCDFKPDNVMHVGDEVKLIDLGGVRRIDDEHSPTFGTLGYQAPEVPLTGPTVASDLYTIGRTLMVLTLDWPEWQRADREQLPGRDDHPLLVGHDCLWRFFRRACHPDPALRFEDAAEMADQLDGVLRQVAATVDGAAQPYTGTRWGGPQPTLDVLTWRTLPKPVLPDHPDQPDRITGAAVGDTAIQIAERMVEDPSLPSELSWADAATVALAYCARDPRRAGAFVAQLDADDDAATSRRPTIRAARSYLEGIVALAQGDIDVASDHFDAAYSAAPGEAAAALAYATVLEQRGHQAQLQADLAARERGATESELDESAEQFFNEAGSLYDQVVMAHPWWVGAVAGLARTLKALRRHTDGARVFLAVPKAHPLRAEALVRACEYMAGHYLATTLDPKATYDETVAAAASTHLEPTEPRHRPAAEAELAVALYVAALRALDRGEAIAGDVAGQPPEPGSLSRAAEAAMLELADLTPDPVRRRDLHDKAAQTRPWTFW